MTAVAPQSVVPRPFPPVNRPRGSRFLGYLSTTDPKRLGVMYIVTSFVFFMVGGVLALLMRAELARPGLQFLSPEQYNQLFTMHGTIMLLFYATPARQRGQRLSAGVERCGGDAGGGPFHLRRVAVPCGFHVGIGPREHRRRSGRPSIHTAARWRRRTRTMVGHRDQVQPRRRRRTGGWGRHPSSVPSGDQQAGSAVRGAGHRGAAAPGMGDHGGVARCGSSCVHRCRGQAADRSNEPCGQLMTAARVPAPDDLAVRGAAHAAAERVLTLLGVPVAMEVDLVEGPADGPEVLVFFGHKPRQPNTLRDQSGWAGPDRRSRLSAQTQTVVITTPAITEQVPVEISNKKTRSRSDRDSATHEPAIPGDLRVRFDAGALDAAELLRRAGHGDIRKWVCCWPRPSRRSRQPTCSAPGPDLIGRVVSSRAPRRGPAVVERRIRRLPSSVSLPDREVASQAWFAAGVVTIGRGPDRSCAGDRDVQGSRWPLIRPAPRCRSRSRPRGRRGS